VQSANALVLTGQAKSYGTLNEFSCGVARNAPIHDLLRRILAKRDGEDFPVVLWKTSFVLAGSREGS
jgi:hypothetical protein